MAGTRFGSKKASTKKAGTRKYQCREGSNPPGRVSIKLKLLRSEKTGIEKDITLRKQKSDSM